jgi:LuxR family maltose regulon positive regulatory protein
LGAAASLRRLGSLRLSAGQLHAARDLYLRSLEISVDGAGRRWPIAGRALMHLAELSYEWNELDAAERTLSESIPLAAKVSPAWNAPAYVTLAQVRQARSDSAGARQALQEARQLAAQSDTELDDMLVGAGAARLALAQGDSAMAQQWIAERARRPAHGVGARDVDALLTTVWAKELEGTLLARLALARGEGGRAEALLAPLLEAAQQQERGHSVIRILVLLALASQAAGDLAAALATINRALESAEPEGYVRLFVDEGEPMAHLLRRIVGRHRKYAQRLLAAFPAPGGRQPAASAPAAAGSDGSAPMAEPLTDRESDILRLIAEGRSNREIGAALFLAPGTVKSYTYSLYGKLGVHSRTQAIARARVLGLLPPD